MKFQLKKNTRAKNSGILIFYIAMKRSLFFIITSTARLFLRAFFCIGATYTFLSAFFGTGKIEYYSADNGYEDNDNNNIFHNKIL